MMKRAWLVRRSYGDPSDDDYEKGEWEIRFTQPERYETSKEIVYLEVDPDQSPPK